MMICLEIVNEDDEIEKKIMFAAKTTNCPFSYY